MKDDNTSAGRERLGSRYSGVISPDNLSRLAPDVAAAIRGYTPSRTAGATPAAIAAVLPLAREWVAAAEPNSAEQARRLMWGLTRKLLWDHNRGTRLEASVVLHAQNVRSFLGQAHEAEKPGWGSNCLWVLKKVGMAMGAAGWGPAQVRFKAGTPAVPYTAEQESSFRQQAGQRHRSNRRDLLWVLAGACGCGLSGVELRYACPDNLIDLGDDRMGVRVSGPKPRVVPVRTDYTDLVIMAAESTPNSSEPFITGTSPGRVYSVSSKLVGRDGTLSLTRARTTWLCAHLRTGTPLASLRKIAGPVSADTLTHLLAHTTADLDDLEAANQGLQP